MFRKSYGRHEDNELREAVARHPGDWVAVAQELGGTPNQYRCRWDRIKKRGEGHIPAVLSVPAEAEPIDQDVLWEKAESQTSRDCDRSASERVLRVNINDDKPIAIMFASDQHLAMRGSTNVKQARLDAELCADTPGLYGFLGGDGPNNHIKHHAALVASGSRPTDEWALYDKYLSFFEDKLLGLISGNHCDWTRDFTGVDKTSELAAKSKIFYAPDEALISLELPGAEYRIKVRHQFHMNSKMNLVHAVKQLWTYGNDDFDVGILCHHHEPAVEPFFRHGRMVWGARPGSYQITSAHSRRYGYALTHPTCPTFIFWPMTHKVRGFIDVADAADYLTYLRERGT